MIVIYARRDLESLILVELRINKCSSGPPEATFISLCGRLKEELSAVGLKVCTMCLRCSWSTRIRDTCNTHTED